MLGVRNGPAAVAPEHLNYGPSSERREAAQDCHWDRASLAAGSVVLEHDGRDWKIHTRTVAQRSISNEDWASKTTARNRAGLTELPKRPVQLTRLRNRIQPFRRILFQMFP
jgi:hypothetical protein